MASTDPPPASEAPPPNALPSGAASPWKAAALREGRDLASAVTGGAIVGMPLLFTMEMWWHGAALSPWHLLGLLGAIVLLNGGFDLLSGFREQYSPAESLGEAVTSVAVGLVFSLVVLGLIGELSSDASAHEKAGKLLVTALALSVGASFANSQVRKRSRTGDDEGQDEGQDEAQADERQSGSREAAWWRGQWRDLGATVAGSTVFSLNVAPTEEILLVAARLSPWQQAGLLAFEIVLCYVILFASGFGEDDQASGSSRATGAASRWQESLFATALSLAVAAVLVALLGQRPATDSLPLFIAAALTLGLPATVGGAAGRLVA